ncbi:MAG: PAS domain-containing protein, partial [Verrucomicrobia bacterium]|nr:PAS domain-containing protein [Verrucomicrobiota bacterium]
MEARTAELAEAHQRLSNILWGTGVGTWEWTVQTGGTRFNERWAELLGYTLDELAPVSIDTWKRLAHPDDLVASGAALERHFSGATEAYEFESRMLHKQGHWIWVYDRGRVASRSEGGRPLWMAGTHFDITERKRGEEALAELRAGLEQRVEEAVADLRTKDQLLISQGRHAAMGEMIGNIAHQWRQPLNALALVLANLRDSSRFGELDAATVDQAVAVGNRLIGKMSSTISVFANFFRPEEEPRAFSGLAQLRETLTLVEASFKNAGIALDLEAPAEVAFFGYANEYSQVLLNLLGNAREAIEGSQVTPGRVSLRLEEREGLGCLTVRDNGGGIAQDLLGKVFDP